MRTKNCTLAIILSINCKYLLILLTCKCRLTTGGILPRFGKGIKLEKFQNSEK